MTERVLSPGNGWGTKLAADVLLCAAFLPERMGFIPTPLEFKNRQTSSTRRDPAERTGPPEDKGGIPWLNPTSS